MAQAAPTPAPAPASASGGPPRRTRLVILLAFVGTFLALLIVFRAVLFPFLMAIFVAYLIEPVVDLITRWRVFGVRWTRGPAIVLMYVVVLGAIVLASSCAVTGLARQARDMGDDVRGVLAERGETARVRIEGGRLPSELRLPAGSRVVLVPSQGPEPELAPPPAVEPGEAPAPPTLPPAPPQPPEAAPAVPMVFATQHEVRVAPGDAPPPVLLGRTQEPVPHGARVGDLLEPGALRLVDGQPLPAKRTVRFEGTGQAKGLELWLERTLISPIQRNLADAGFDADAAPVREFVRVKQEAFGQDLARALPRYSATFALALAKSLYTFLLILMLTAFIVMDRRRISAFFASLPPDHLKPEYGRLIEYIDSGLAGVIRGQLVICAVNGVLTWIGLLLLGVNGAGLLSLVAGVLSLIPIFGTIVSSIPIVLVASTQGLGTGALALGWIGLIHLVEANLLNPLIMGSHANMHPVVIVFALLAGEHAFGAWGALLAVPTMSILQSCFQFYRYEIEGVPRPTTESHGAWLRRAFGRVTGRGTR